MLRLSPNEEARLLADETARRRRERLAQVRERSRAHASKVLSAVKTEKCKQLQALASKIEADWEEEKALRISQLLQLQDACLRAIGHGHTAARNWDPGHEERVRLMMEDNERAEQRHRAALERLRKEQAELDETDRRSELQRSMAREKERLRARRIASLPHRPPDPVLAALGASDGPRAPADACRWDVARELHCTSEDAERADSGGYGNNDEIEPDVIVERASPAAASEGASRRSADATTGDGRKAAAIVEAQLARARDETARKESERREAARLRHRHALHKEVLHKDYQQMLTELDDLQRADRRRRQQVLERIPRSLYLPPHVVLEKEAERQVEMERQFEELYESVAGNVADVRNLATDVGPLGGTPTASDDTDSAIADHSTSCVAAAAPASAASPALASHPRQANLAAPLKDVTNVVMGAPITSDATTRPQQKRAALNKLISRIRDQKSSWVVAQTTQSEDGDETVGSDAADYGRTSPTNRGKTIAEARDVERPAPAELLLSSPGLSTVSSGNVHSTSTDALSTPTLSQYTIESSSDGAAGQVASHPGTVAGASRKHSAGLKAEDAIKGLPSGTSRLPSAAGELSKPITARKKHDEADRSSDSIDGRNDDGSTDDDDDDDGDDGDDNGGRQGLETEEPLIWIEKQKRNLRQRLDAIAAQRQALENLQTAAQQQLLLASEPAVGQSGESVATSDAGERYESERERRVREYQRRLLSRGLGSDGRATLNLASRRDEQIKMRAISPGGGDKVPVSAPSSTMRGRARAEIITPSEQAISSRQPPQLAATAADRADIVPDRSQQLLSGHPAAGLRRQPEIVTTAPARRSPVSPAAVYLLSDDASGSWPDSSVDLSSIPGYIPPAQREALLFQPYTVHAAGSDPVLQTRNEAATIAPKLVAASSASKSLLTSATSRPAATDASQPLASGTRSLGSAGLHLGDGAAGHTATAAPSGTAISGRREVQSYVSIEERERLLADLDLTPTVRHPSLGKFSASSSPDASLATTADVDTWRRPSVAPVRSSSTMATDRLYEHPRPDGKRVVAAASTMPDYIGAAGPTSSERITESRRAGDRNATTAGAAVALLKPAAIKRVVTVNDGDNTVVAQLNPSFRPRHEPQRATAAAAAADTADGMQGDSAATSAILSAALAQQMLERQLAFNDRQEELRRQLAEIQRQKSEILLRYQAPKPTSTAGTAYAVGTTRSEEIGSRLTSTDVAARTLSSDNRSEPRSGHTSQLCEESSASPNEPPSASRHFLSTIEEVDDTESKLESGTESDRTESDRYYDDDEGDQGSRTGETTTGALSLSGRSNIERHAERQQAADTAARYDGSTRRSDFQRHVASPQPPTASSSGLYTSSAEHESRQIQDRGPFEAELSSGTLTTTNSSSSAGTSSYNPLQLDCSATTITDPSSGSTNDLIIENSLWPSKPYGSEAATFGDRAATVGYSSSPEATSSDATSRSSVAASSSPRASDSTSEAGATSKLVACEESPSSLSSGAGSGSSFRPLALDDSSSNTEKSAGAGRRAVAAVGASSESEGSSREPAFEMTDGVERGAYASGEVVSLRYREPNSTSSQEMSISSPPLDALGSAYTSTMRPLSEAEDADYIDFVGTRPPSSTPMKYPPSATDPRLSEGADCFSDLLLNTSAASSQSSVPDILQEPELTFITMSASSALEESDLPDVTLTPDEQHVQHRDDGHSDKPDGAAAAAMPRAAAVVPSRLTRSEATAGAARQSRSTYFSTQRTKRLTDAVVVTSAERKKLEQENRQRTKLLYERLEEVQAQKQAKAREQMRLQAPNRRSEYDAKLKQRKRAAQQAKDSSQPLSG